MLENSFLVVCRNSRKNRDLIFEFLQEGISICGLINHSKDNIYVFTVEYCSVSILVEMSKLLSKFATGFNEELLIENWIKETPHRNEQRILFLTLLKNKAA